MIPLKNPITLNYSFPRTVSKMPIPNFSDLLEQILDGQSAAFDKLCEYYASDFSAEDINLLKNKIGKLGNKHRAYPFELALTALMHQKGLGEQVDHQLALQIYRQAIDKNNACSMYCSAVMYRKGHGVKANSREANRLLEQAIELDHVPSMSLLASIYEDEKNYEGAVELYELAIEFDYPPALFELARMYEYGRGIKKDRTRAKELYTIAVELDHAPSMNNLAWIYIEDEKNYEEALKLFKMAIEKESPTAMNSLAWMYEKAFAHNNKVNQKGGRLQSMYNLDLRKLGDSETYLSKAWLLYYQSYCIKATKFGLEELQRLSKKIADREVLWSIFLETEPFKGKGRREPLIYLLEGLSIDVLLDKVNKINDKQQQKQIREYLELFELKKELEGGPTNPIFYFSQGNQEDQPRVSGIKGIIPWPSFFRRQYLPLNEVADVDIINSCSSSHHIGPKGGAG